MEFRIDRLGMEGDGIATGPQGDIYAPFTLPTEIVRGQLEGDRLANVGVLQSSPQRIAPVCKHFGTCGGCALQHASDPFLADWKVDIIRRALAAHGLTAPFRAIVSSPPNSRKRAVFAGRRTKKTVQVGFHGRNSGAIVPIEECHLIVPELLSAMPALQKLAKLGATRNTGIRMSVSVSDTGLDVGISEAKELEASVQEEVISIAIEDDFARLTWNGDVIALARPPSRRFGNAQVTPPSAAFGQATSQGEAALVAGVLEAVSGASRVADLFSGCGTFTLPLAEKAEVHAVEFDQAMLAALDAGWRHANGLKRVTHESRDLFNRPLLPAELNHFDAIVIDPPRAGAQAQCTQIAPSKITRLAYVSCNPVTFARDVKQLAVAGFIMDWLQPVDQFRWSGHVELVASFRR